MCKSIEYYPRLNQNHNYYMRIYTVKKKTHSFLFVALLCVIGSMSSFTTASAQDTPTIDSTVVAEADTLHPLIKPMSFPVVDTEEKVETLYEKFYNNLISEAMKYLGTPYRWGGKSTKAFDCSGFTSYVFEKQGVEISRTSREQIKNGEKVDVNELKPGDLIFFNGRSGVGTKRIGHVGIVVANNGDGNVEFIHSARGGVQTSNLNDDPYYKKRYVAGCRVKPSEEKVKEIMQQPQFTYPVV